jgi:hypothetical protein
MKALSFVTTVQLTPWIAVSLGPKASTEDAPASHAVEAFASFSSELWCGLQAPLTICQVTRLITSPVIVLSMLLSHLLTSLSLSAASANTASLWLYKLNRFTFFPERSGSFSTDATFIFPFGPPVYENVAVDGSNTHLSEGHDELKIPFTFICNLPSVGTDGIRGDLFSAGDKLPNLSSLGFDFLSAGDPSLSLLFAKSPATPKSLIFGGLAPDSMFDSTSLVRSH